MNASSMFRNPPFLAGRRRKSSSALVIVLGMLALVSVLILVFFERSTGSRMVSFSSNGQFRADCAAHTALDVIVGDLRNEILAGSVSTNVNGYTLYVPTASQTVAPYQVYSQGLTNLVAQSAGTSNFWDSSVYPNNSNNPIRSMAGNNTASASANNHFISTNRWNKPGLLGDPGDGSTPNLPTPPSGTSYVPPDWVILTRAGALTNAPGTTYASLATKSGANYAVGRYAYTIYDEGGLLDANVVGCPQTLTNAATSDFSTRRGLLAQVNLANLFANAAVNDVNTAGADADALVTWRNKVSSASGTTYTNAVFTATNGFSTVLMSGDQAFVGRQDLINYIKNRDQTAGSKLSGALPFLGTFSRAVNAPSYAPPAISSAYRKATLANEGKGTTGSFKPNTAQFGLDDKFNPSLINTRVITSFARDGSSSWSNDGQTAQVGEPLIKYRFPLSRLDWIRYDGYDATMPAGVTAAKILNAFGLTWYHQTTATAATQSSGTGSGYWVYDHGARDSSNNIIIYRLDQVAKLSPPREPDFFELLQAAMYAGSLGKQGPSILSTGTTASDLADADTNIYNQIIQIGANLIDQYDADSYPTRLRLGPASNPGNYNPLYEFDGVENLPYLTRVYEGYTTMDPPGTPVAPGSHNIYGMWFLPQVWNPHTTLSNQPISNLVPASFKFTVNGSAGNNASVSVNMSGSSVVSNSMSFGPYSVPPGNSTGLTFKISGATASPVLLQSAQGITMTGAESAAAPALIQDHVPANTYGGTTGNIPEFYGVYVGQSTFPNPSTSTPIITPEIKLNGAAVSFNLWFQDQGSNWILYSRMRPINPSLPSAPNGADVASPQTSDTQGPPASTNLPNLHSGIVAWYYYTRSDPRTDRFGILGTTDFNKKGALDPSGASALPPNRATATYSNTSDHNYGGYVLVDPSAQGWHLNDTSPALGKVVGSGSANRTLWFYTLSENKASGNPGFVYYMDPDNVNRRGDGAYATGALTGGGYPFATDPLNPPQSRPVILNRPFRSVGDMGYAFRDQPWKHIDFFTQESADAGLLDLFCVNEPRLATSSDPVVEAGRVDLNTRNEPVLETIITGAVQWDVSSGSLATDASTAATQATIPAAKTAPNTAVAFDLANSITTMTTGTFAGQGPLLNRSELVTRWMMPQNYPATVATSPAGVVKKQREAPVRALAEVGDTRTWNLLIDVIAQSGRYVDTPTAVQAADFNKGFVVEGEKRYWLHVSIDRYTGKVIAQSLEPVYE